MALKLAQTAEISRAFSAGDIEEYIALGGHRPADGEVPEPLIGALFSYLLGVKLPGSGTNYLKQESEFKALAFVGEMLTARVEVTRVRPEKRLADLKTTCHNEKGELICEGRAVVLIPAFERKG